MTPDRRLHSDLGRACQAVIDGDTDRFPEQFLHRCRDGDASLALELLRDPVRANNRVHDCLACSRPIPPTVGSGKTRAGFCRDTCREKYFRWMILGTIARQEPLRYLLHYEPMLFSQLVSPEDLGEDPGAEEEDEDEEGEGSGGA